MKSVSRAISACGWMGLVCLVWLTQSADRPAPGASLDASRPAT